MNVKELNIDALTTAITALSGTNGANIIAELYKLLDNAEVKGYNEGYLAGYNSGSESKYDHGDTEYDEGFRAGYDFGYSAAADGDVPNLSDEYATAAEEAAYRAQEEFFG